MGSDVAQVTWVPIYSPDTYFVWVVIIPPHFTLYRVYGINIQALYYYVLVLYQDGVYFRLGQLMAMALVHAGVSLRILSPAVFNYLSGMKPGDIIIGISECPDAAIRDLLWKVYKNIHHVLFILNVSYTKGVGNILKGGRTDELRWCLAV